MGPLTFASSQNEETDFAAERRWENEGGNPGQLQQPLRDDRICNSSYRAQVPPNCKRHDQNPDGMRRVPRAANVAQITSAWV
jgi:hypothetical protein